MDDLRWKEQVGLYLTEYRDQLVRDLHHGDDVQDRIDDINQLLEEV